MSDLEEKAGTFCNVYLTSRGSQDSREFQASPFRGRSCLHPALTERAGSKILRKDSFLESLTTNVLLLVSLQCEKCNLHFRHKSQLRLHLRQKHGAITNTKVQYRVSAADLPPELPKAC